MRGYRSNNSDGIGPLCHVLQLTCDRLNLFHGLNRCISSMKQMSDDIFYDLLSMARLMLTVFVSQDTSNLCFGYYIAAWKLNPGYLRDRYIISVMLY